MITERFLMGRHRQQMTDIEKQVLEDAVGNLLKVEARHELVRHGERVDRSMLLVDGFICRYMDGLGGDRQLVALHVPGDFVDLHGYPMRELDHDVATVSACTIATFAHDAIERLIVEHPNLGRLLWFSTLLDGSMHREWIFRLGRLPALGRIAHLFAETGRRLQMVGIGDGTAFDLPLQHADLASACGITTVHISRVLRQLRERGIATFAQNRVVVHDLPALHTLAEFDDGYLYPSRR